MCKANDRGMGDGVGKGGHTGPRSLPCGYNPVASGQWTTVSSSTLSLAISYATHCVTAIRAGAAGNKEPDGRVSSRNRDASRPLSRFASRNMDMGNRGHEKWPCWNAHAKHVTLTGGGGRASWTLWTVDKGVFP